MSITDQEIEKLKELHPGKELHLITLERDEQELEFVVLSPSKVIVSKYLQELGKDDGNAFKAAESFVLACCIYPERKIVQEIFDNAPLLISALNKDLEKLAGLGAVSKKKKL